jgi:hypothetical protein
MSPRRLSQGNQRCPSFPLITISAIYPKQLKAEMGKDKPLCSPWALRETIDFVVGNSDDLVHIDWSSDWNPEL